MTFLTFQHGCTIYRIKEMKTVKKKTCLISIKIEVHIFKTIQCSGKKSIAQTKLHLQAEGQGEINILPKLQLLGYDK